MPTIGSQAILRVLPRTHYDFRAVKFGTIMLPVAQHIDVLGYDRVALQVRVHSGQFPKMAALQFQFADDGFSAEDAASEFLQTKAATGEDIGSLRIDDRTALPFYQAMSVGIGGKIGRMLAITLSATGDAEGGPAATVSLDLILSGGHVGTSIHQPSAYLGYALENGDRADMFEPLLPRESEPLDDAMIDRVAAAVRDALRGQKSASPYPRFGNVNVGIAPDTAVDQCYVRFSNVDVAMSRAPASGGEHEE
jgi:hypothetical protein